MKKTIVSLGFTSLLCIGACSSAQNQSTEASEREVMPAPGVEIGSEDWTKSDAESTPLAEVGGVVITLKMVKAVQDASGEIDAREALERLIELEVLAQHGQEKGLHESVHVRQTRRQALVQRYLKGGFEPDVKPESLSLEKARELYYVPDIRKLYDHADAWRMAHVFFTCCDPKSESCEQPAVLACFSETAGSIQSVYTELKTLSADVEGDVAKVLEVMETYRSNNENRFYRHPFAFRARAFYYDPNKAHDEQKGYDIIAEPVARKVIDAELGVIQEPVQSPFGWHVIVKLAHDPEERRSVDDPSVIADIRQNMLPKLRQARFRGLLGKLAQDLGVEMYPAPLEYLNVRFNARL